MAAEGFVLDPNAVVGAALDLGTTTGALRLDSLTVPPAQKLPQWITGGDSDGAALARPPYYANRECSMQIRVTATTKDLAVAAIGTLEGKLQQAEYLSPGLQIRWTPGGATVGYYLYMLLGQITDLPVDVSSGWVANRPLITVQFSCKPFLYATETSVAQVSTSTITVPSVAGDVSAEARLVITDGSSKLRRFVEWGLEQRYYNAGSPSSLIIDSASLTTSGYAGSNTARTGAQGGTTIAAPLFSQPIAVCGIPAQPHIGSFRIKGRVYAPSTSEYWRLTWKVGDGPYISNDYAQPIVPGDFSEIDFGMIDVDPVEAGAQSWSGRIEAYTSTVGGETGEFDRMKVVPAAEGYGRLASNYSYSPGVITAYDNFVGTGGSAINGHAAAGGGTWATSGATTDLVYSDPATTGYVAAQRNTSSDTGPRYAILGTATPTDSEADIQLTILMPASFSIRQVQSSLILRWTDANNNVRLIFDTLYGLILQQVVSGTVTVLANQVISGPLLFGATYEMRLIAYASGRALGWLFDSGGATVASVDATSTAIATGGALASGKVGFADQQPAGSPAATRYYDNFYAATPTIEQTVINSGQSLEIRSDANLRQSSDGTAYGDIPSRGSRLFIPPAGSGNRTTRIFVTATRNDLTTQADTSVADADTTNIRVYWTPRYLAVPR